jgi:hypothetical protein
MNERAQLIKTAIALELSKEGKTLLDLETALVSPDITKTASPTYADFMKWLDTIKASGALMGTSAVVGGGAVGAGAYGAYLANEDSDNKQLKKMKEIQQYAQARKQLQNNITNPITI